jgi:peptide/nickel transport system substrate-binding protein
MIRTALALTLAAGVSLFAASAHAQGTLRIGMTASDIPLTTGQTDQGGEGMRFMGYTVYDALINWDLSKSNKASDLTPGLATSWAVDAADKNKWTFVLREGVKFHDGSEFTADAVVWNLDKLLKNDAPQFDQRQAAQGRSRIPAVASYKVVDKYKVEITTKAPDATLPYQIAWVMMSSPAQWEKLGKSWEAFAKTPSGTGPWQLTAFQPRERAELSPFPGYWDKARVPKLDKMVLLPLPEANARAAALRAGQVDWIEAPSPDLIPSLKGAGFQIITNAYPHNWTWHLSRAEGSPWNDIRVRKAANLAVDRQGLKELLGGLMIPAEGFYPPGHQWFGNPKFKLKLDQAEAKKLLAEAGFSPAKPVTTKILIAPSGSGQMQPLQMNEFVQQNLDEVGIKLSLNQVDSAAMYELGKNLRDRELFYTGYVTQPDPSWSTVWFTCRQFDEWNWMYWCDEEYDRLHFAALKELDEARRQEMYVTMQQRWDEAAHTIWTHWPTLYFGMKAGVEPAIINTGYYIAQGFRLT